MELVRFKTNKIGFRLIYENGVLYKIMGFRVFKNVLLIKINKTK